MPSSLFYDQIFHVTDIDRRKCTREVPMKVLSLGLCRTGSESLMKALKILGINQAYHGYDAIITDPRDCEMWLEALRAKYDGVGKPYGREEFDRLLGHCQAVSGLPAICFIPELIKAYPEAKVILTVRDPEQWFNSMSQMYESFGNPLLAQIIGPINAMLSNIFLTSSRYVWPTFDRAGWIMLTNDFKKNGRQVYKDCEMVRCLVPPENLLEYHVREGWGPLCKFLGHPIPDVPIPNGNEKDILFGRNRQVLINNLKECLCNAVQGAAYLSLSITLLRTINLI